MTTPPTNVLPTNSAATDTPSASGANASPDAASTDFKTHPAPDDPGAFPPEGRAAVVAIATSKTEDHDRPTNGWTLDEIAATIINEAHAQAVHRSTIWRVLRDADLKPHKSVYWLNSHDPDFDAKAQAICRLYLDAPGWYQQGRLVLCCDEKTGMQILRRVAPTRLPAPGQLEKREFEYERLGTRTMITTFAVPTGEVVWDLGPTRTSLDFRAHVLRVAYHWPDMAGFDWVVDNLNTHASLDLCEVVAYLNGVPFEPGRLRTMPQRRAFLSEPSRKHVFHYTPRHGSWLNQVELFFSVLSRQFLRRGDFASVAEFEGRVRAYLDAYNLERAHPYRWTYTGEPLVRGVAEGDSRAKRRRQRAWFGSRPQLYERLLHPPRAYRRRTKPLAANI
jgi:DDE superfamily endonuclease